MNFHHFLSIVVIEKVLPVIHIFDMEKRCANVCETSGAASRDSPRTAPPSSVLRRAAQRASAEEDLGPLRRRSGRRLEKAAGVGETVDVGEELSWACPAQKVQHDELGFGEGAYDIEVVVEEERVEGCDGMSRCDRQTNCRRREHGRNAVLVGDIGGGRQRDQQ